MAAYQGWRKQDCGFAVTKPIADKAEVALEFPDKLYIGTFERSAVLMRISIAPAYR